MLNRSRGIHKLLPFSLIILIAVFSVAACGALPADTFSVILCIGDGMGPEQIKAASYYTAGEDGALSFQDFPVTRSVTTYSADNMVTDSAASATAMATGVKVNNGVISRYLPGDGSDIETIAEIFQGKGKALGLVTTAFMTHATPAAFAAHTEYRGNYEKIAGDYFNRTRPNILFGGGGSGIDRSLAESAGYTVVTNRREMNASDLSGTEYISGQFGISHLPYEYDGLGDLPRLHEMTHSTRLVTDRIFSSQPPITRTCTT